MHPKTSYFGILKTVETKFSSVYRKHYLVITNETGNKLYMSRKFKNIAIVEWKCKKLIGRNVRVRTWKPSFWSNRNWFCDVFEV